MFTGLKEFSAAMDRMIAAADVAARTIVTEGGKAIVESTHAHMDGRPGPMRRSGRLYDSVRSPIVTSLGAARWQSETAPSGVPYERRIELGFTGTDSRGRHYHQPPFPYLKPGFEDATPKIDAIARAAWFGATRAG